MELLFLGVLFVLMIIALTSGFPVAFSLPGAAIIAMLLAGSFGYFFEGDINAYFAQDGPKQWLSAGVTNFRSLYWIVERDTLIAIPLFIFMGIMLQRSKIAEDLLLSMAQLFGSIPGGLGVSVVFVGALLAATTGIVGATVIAMGLISLPAMLRNNYSKSLACGTICASGTLGQIIPPSIVLIILADQLSNAADQANSLRKELYRTTTGEYSMPSQFDVVSASAGDMFMGALVPGLILVGLYMAYILIYALIKPEVAPPIPFEGQRDGKFFRRVALSLIPPLALIFMVLGSIISGIATVNQAGSIGAIGAMIMAGYRLHEGKRFAYLPAIIALFSSAAILFLVSRYNLNIKSTLTSRDEFGVILAFIAVFILLLAIGWSAWRTYRIDNTLREVMSETVKTTSMVFIILIGAAMLTSAFRAFGGEEIVKHFLTGLPGGFWTQFVVVMLVIFLLGFFLDFIEIAVVVVPIVAPILLANPEANVSAVWFGVMVGLNIQTSFLTPPFGFALFYLRGVADKVVKTLDIYKGAIAFIGLQLLGLTVAGFFPALVNYLPIRTHLTSETSPPPINPGLQSCLEEYTQNQFLVNSGQLNKAILTISSVPLIDLNEHHSKQLALNIEQVKASPALLTQVMDARLALTNFIPTYKPVQKKVRDIQRKIRIIDELVLDLKDQLKRNPNASTILIIDERLAAFNKQRTKLNESQPENWEPVSTQFQEYKKTLNQSRREYQNNVDTTNTQLSQLLLILKTTDETKTLNEPFKELKHNLRSKNLDQLMLDIKILENTLTKLVGVSDIKIKLSKARRALKKGEKGRDKALEFYQQAAQLYQDNILWRAAASTSILPALQDFRHNIRTTVGIRGSKKLTLQQAKYIAKCQAGHEDISIYF